MACLINILYYKILLRFWLHKGTFNRIKHTSLFRRKTVLVWSYFVASEVSMITDLSVYSVIVDDKKYNLQELIKSAKL